MSEKTVFTKTLNFFSKNHDSSISLKNLNVFYAVSWRGSRGVFHLNEMSFIAKACVTVC